MTIRKSLVALVVGVGGAASVNAASIYLAQPSSPQFVDPGTTSATFDLMMNFSAAESTVGGGIDIDVSGSGSFGSFTPSTYFTTAADSAFSGHGTARADADYEIHFGSFNGLSGVNNLGRITLAIDSSGRNAAVSLARRCPAFC